MARSLLDRHGGQRKDCGGVAAVQAFNTATASENKIHDDAVARRFGFGGGLVPGVDVYAYMAHQPVARWGRAWLERGAAECRFQKPVYDGDIATVTAKETAEGLDLRVDSHGELCASGSASLPDGLVPSSELFAEPPRPPSQRPRRAKTRSLSGPCSVSVRSRLLAIWSSNASAICAKPRHFT